MSAEIATFEAEIKEYRLQVCLCAHLLAFVEADNLNHQLETVQLGLQADPDNAELQELQAELEQVISLTEAAIAELKPSPVLAAAPKNESSPPAKEKWSRENHPAFKKSATAPAVEDSEGLASFKVNDTVLAKWHAGDKGFYPARITSITGSSASPIYIVKFKADGTTETLRAKDIKPIVNPNKRKADGTPVAASINTPPPPPPVNSSVISAAADIDTTLAQQTKKEPSKVSDGPTRPAKIAKKIKANKELEAGKNKWQDFATKGKFGKAAKKESMFRTPEGVHGRGKYFRPYHEGLLLIHAAVGFTGSGQTMRKDPTRSRHIYQTNGDEE